MGTNRFLSMLFAIIFGSIVFGMLRDVMGFEMFAVSTMVVLGMSMIYLWTGRDMNELSFWLILTYAGKNFDGGLYLLYFGVVFIYILMSVGFITIQRK